MSFLISITLITLVWSAFVWRPWAGVLLLVALALTGSGDLSHVCFSDCY